MRYIIRMGLIVIGLLLFAGSAQAAVIEVNEWANLTKLGWTYAPGPLSGTADDPMIDTSTDTPSGGGALRFVYKAGNYPTSYGPGNATFILSGKTELYIGHWVKWSSGFTWNSIGTKIDYMTLTDANAQGNRDNFLILTHFNGYNSLPFTQQLFAAPSTQNRYPNKANVSFQTDRWYWIEYHALMNTVGQPNGIWEAWVDDVLVSSYTNVTYRTYNSTWGVFNHAPVWGGGGGTIGADQYLWVDHTVISTTRIGIPQAGGDTTPPAMPMSFIISQAIDWLVDAWTMASGWIFDVESAYAEPVNFSWLNNTEPDLSTYRLYQLSADGQYVPIATIDGTQNTYALDIPRGITDQTVFFVLTALDLTGNESKQSQEASKVIPAIIPPAPATVTGLTIVQASAEAIVIEANTSDCSKITTSTKGSTTSKYRRTVTCQR